MLLFFLLLTVGGHGLLDAEPAQGVRGEARPGWGDAGSLTPGREHEAGTGRPRLPLSVGAVPGGPWTGSSGLCGAGACGLRCRSVKLPHVFISEKPVSPKSGTLKSPPKGFDTTAINKSYYNVVSNCKPVFRLSWLFECLSDSAV